MNKFTAFLKLCLSGLTSGTSELKEEEPETAPEEKEPNPFTGFGKLMLDLVLFGLLVAVAGTRQRMGYLWLFAIMLPLSFLPEFFHGSNREMSLPLPARYGYSAAYWLGPPLLVAVLGAFAGIIRIAVGITAKGFRVYMAQLTWPEYHGVGLLFTALVLLGGIYFFRLLVLRESRKKKEHARSMILLLCLAASACVCIVLGRRGYFREVGLTEFPTLFGSGLVGAAAIFASGSAYFAWKESLKQLSLRPEIQKKNRMSQAFAAESTIEEENGENHRGKRRKKRLIKLLLLLACLAAWGGRRKERERNQEAMLSFFDHETNDAAAYGGWAEFWDAWEFDEEKKLRQVIFPEEIDEGAVLEYHARVWGYHIPEEERSFRQTMNGSGCEVNAERFLVLQMDESSFAAEKERLAAISLAIPDSEDSFWTKLAGPGRLAGCENRLLHDTEHFPQEAYIAVYENVSRCEYALLDEEALCVTYLCREGDETVLQPIPTSREVDPEGRVLPVPVRMANTARGGYSIYEYVSEEGMHNRIR